MLPRETLVARHQELMGKVETLSGQYKEVDLPDEVGREIDGYLTQAEQIRKDIERTERTANAEAWAAQSRGVAATHHGWQPAEPGEGEAEVDAKAWREFEVKGMYGAPVKVRFNVPLVVQQPGYKSAFESYIRQGKANLGPQDLKTLSEGTDSAGGFLVPEDMQMQILKKVATMTVFRQYARQVTTSRDVVKWTRIKYTTDDNWTSGVRLTWTGEIPSSSTVHRVTDPVFGEIAIPVNTAMASMPVTFDLLEDAAFDIEGTAAELLGEAFGLGEDNVFWNGTGAGQPMGLLTTVDQTDGVSSVVSGHASQLTNNGLVDLIYGLPSQYENGARIYFRKATEKTIRELLNAGSTDYAWPVINQVGNFGAVEPSLLGFPISRSEFVPAIAANAYPIVFGQLSGYIIVDRVGLSVRRYDEIYVETNQALIVARKRVGGQVAQPERLRVQKVST